MILHIHNRHNEFTLTVRSCCRSLGTPLSPWSSLLLSDTLSEYIVRCMSRTEIQAKAFQSWKAGTVKREREAAVPLCLFFAKGQSALFHRNVIEELITGRPIGLEPATINIYGERRWSTKWSLTGQLDCWRAYQRHVASTIIGGKCEDSISFRGAAVSHTTYQQHHSKNNVAKCHGRRKLPCFGERDIHVNRVS